MEWNRKKGGMKGKEKKKTQRKLSYGNTMPVSRGQNEMIGEFKMAAGDVISTGGRLPD